MLMCYYLGLINVFNPDSAFNYSNFCCNFKCDVGSQGEKTQQT